MIRGSLRRFQNGSVVRTTPGPGEGRHVDGVVAGEFAHDGEDVRP